DDRRVVASPRRDVAEVCGGESLDGRTFIDRSALKPGGTDRIQRSVVVEKLSIREVLAELPWGDASAVVAVDDDRGISERFDPIERPEELVQRVKRAPLLVEISLVQPFTLASQGFPAEPMLLRKEIRHISVPRRPAGPIESVGRVRHQEMGEVGPAPR